MHEFKYEQQDSAEMVLGMELFDVADTWDATLSLVPDAKATQELIEAITSKIEAIAGSVEFKADMRHVVAAAILVAARQTVQLFEDQALRRAKPESTDHKIQ